MEGRKILMPGQATEAKSPNKPARPDGVVKRGLDEAIKYVSKNWFPINKPLFDLIKKNLVSGYYDQNPARLLSDLKADFSLYTYFIRKLGETVEETEIGLSPSDILAKVGLEKAKKLLLVSEDEISMHKFSPENKFQTLGIKLALISANTAETLAEKTKLDSQMAFMCASARQAGLSLIAWNYPRIYSKALSSVGNSEEALEITLGRALGYSPTQLGLRCILDWNKCPDLRVASGLDELPGDLPAGEEENENSQTYESSKLRHFCEIGESVAHISAPEHYPNAAKEWEKVSSEIKHYMGPSGIGSITEKIRHSAAIYEKLDPNLFKIEPSPERNVLLAARSYGLKRLEANSYVRKCPEATHPLFKKTYESVMPDSPSSIAVNVLASELIPSLGFTRGCVYLVDMKRMVIAPMLRIGNDSLSRYRTVTYSDIAGTNTTNTHPVANAINYSTPLVQEGALVDGEHVAHITATFGGNEKTGVLYLEMGEGLQNETEHITALNYFKAVKQCLCDCLGLRNS